MYVRVRTGERRSQAIHPFTIKWVQPISSGTQRGSTYIPGTPRATKSLPPPSKLPALHLCSVHLRHGQLRFLAQSVLLEDWMQGQRTGTSMTFNIVLLQTKGAPASVTISPNTLQVLPFLRQYLLEAPLELLDPLSLLHGVFSSVFFLPTPTPRPTDGRHGAPATNRNIHRTWTIK